MIRTVTKLVTNAKNDGHSSIRPWDSDTPDVAGSRRFKARSVIANAKTPSLNVTIILDVLGFGILIPVLAPLVLQFTQNGQEGALMFGLLLSVWSLMQFLFSPLTGALSDRFGRRPVLILSAIGLGFDYIIMALA